MQNKNSNRVCSAGFNAKSKSDNKPYVLTAGHCRKGPWAAIFKTQIANDDNANIGPFHNARDDLVADTGILKVTSPNYWRFGKPWITVNPNGGHTANDKYVIKDVLNPRGRDRVCVTAGNWPATTCGTVTDTNTSGSGTLDLFKVSGGLCLKPGDSGSPYFSRGVAYGIHITSPAGASCEWGKAEQATEAASKMNVRILEN